MVRRKFSLFALTLMLVALIYPSFVYSTTTFVVRVLDIDGNPVEGALVTLVAPPPGAYIVADGETDSDGYIRFLLESPPTEVSLIVSWKNLVVYNDKVSPYQGAVMVYANIGDIIIRTMSTSRNPIKGLSVQLSWLSVDGVKRANAVTDKNGVCVFEKMPLIKYNISVYRDSVEIFKKTFDSSVNRDYTVLLELFYISIDIFDLHGNPLAGVSVKLIGDDIVKQGRTDSSGNIVFRYLSGGTYVLEIKYYGYRENRTINLMGDEELKIVLGNFTKHMLRIITIDENSKPVPFIKIEVMSLDGSLSVTGYTDQSGIYITNLYPGNYIVSAYYKNQVKTLDIILNKDEDLKIVFKREGGVSVSVNTLEKILEHISKDLIVIVFLIIFVVFVIIVLFHYMFISRQAM